MVSHVDIARLSEAIQTGQVLPHLPEMGHGHLLLQVDDSMLKKMDRKRIRTKYKTFIDTC